MKKNGVECSSTVLPAGNYTMYAGLGCLSTTTVTATNNATGTSIVNASSYASHQQIREILLEYTLCACYRSPLGAALPLAPGCRLPIAIYRSPLGAACPSHSCDGWVCVLGAVGASWVFGLVRGAGAFAAVLPSFVLVSNMPFAHNRDFATSFSAVSSFRREAMVTGALTRASAFRVGLGVSGAVIVSGSCACPSHLWMSGVCM